MISMTSVPIDTSCVAIKHQSTIARFGDSWDKTGIGITPDPFGRGAYNLQSISATRKKVAGSRDYLFLAKFEGHSMASFSPVIGMRRA